MGAEECNTTRRTTNTRHAASRLVPDPGARARKNVVRKTGLDDEPAHDKAQSRRRHVQKAALLDHFVELFAAEQFRAGAQP